MGNSPRESCNRFREMFLFWVWFQLGWGYPVPASWFQHHLDLSRYRIGLGAFLPWWFWPTYVGEATPSFQKLVLLSMAWNKSSTRFKWFQWLLWSFRALVLEITTPNSTRKQTWEQILHLSAWFEPVLQLAADSIQYQRNCPNTCFSEIRCGFRKHSGKSPRGNSKKRAWHPGRNGFYELKPVNDLSLVQKWAHQ